MRLSRNLKPTSNSLAVLKILNWLRTGIPTRTRDSLILNSTGNVYNILKNSNKFFPRMTHAARAFENCDRSFRPKFAEPKPQGPRFSSYDCYEPNGFDDRSRPYPFRMGPMGKMTNNIPGKIKNHQTSFHTKKKLVIGFNNEPFTKLQILVNPLVTQEQLWRLCDIAPGLEYCRLSPDFKAKSPNVILYSQIIKILNKFFLGAIRGKRDVLNTCTSCLREG